MDARKESERAGMKNRTTIERRSEREVVVTRTFDAPRRLVFEAWTKAELFQRWWVPKSMGATLLSCELDVRTGGSYRLEFGNGDAQPFTFFGRYLDVVPNERIVWTNEESDSGAVTTVTFEEKNGQTLLVLHERYASKEALDEAGGNEDGLPEQFAQLDELLVTLGADQSTS
jgi:uncharacterized protein YndB with AHSA1/START domain